MFPVTSRSSAYAPERDPETPRFAASGPEARPVWWPVSVAARLLSAVPPSYRGGCDGVVDSSPATQPPVVYAQLCHELAKKKFFFLSQWNIFFKSNVTDRGRI